MAKIQIINYSFDKVAKTVTFTDYATINLDSIYAIINVTRNIVIYNPTSTSLNGTVATNVLTLTYDTSAMANTDKLLILYDDRANESTLVGPVTETAPATDTASSGLNGRLQRIAQRISSLITALGSPFQAGGSIGNSSFGAILAAETTKVIGTVNNAEGTNNIGYTLGRLVTLSTDVTRQAADTTTYAINDALSNSTSAPTSGGFTFTSAARASGGSGIISDAIITSMANPALLLAGELWIFNQAVTNINDNAAFGVTDGEIKTLVAVIPFTLNDAGNNSYYHAQNLSIGYTCSGTANLRFLVRVKNAYIPVGSEVITFILKAIQVD